MLTSNKITQQAITAITHYWQAANEDRGLAEQHLAGSGVVFSLENKLKNHYHKKYALCVSNATMGLYALALALDIKAQKFITTPVTYGASLSGFLQAQNQPIFANIDHQTLTLNPDSVRSLITEDIRAILAVDWLGNPSDHIALRQIADEYGIWYIADAAQSLGAYRQGIPASTMADALVVSFTVGKSLFAGEGGAILTDNEELYQKLIWLTQHPYRQKRELGLSLTNEFALNLRIHPLAAAIAHATFEASLEALKQYQNRCFKVIDLLNEIGLTKPLNYRQNEILPSFFRFCAIWQNEEQETALLAQLKQRNCQVNLKSYPIIPLFAHPAYQAQYGHFLAETDSHFDLSSLSLVELSKVSNK